MKKEKSLYYKLIHHVYIEYSILSENELKSTIEQTSDFISHETITIYKNRLIIQLNSQKLMFKEMFKKEIVYDFNLHDRKQLTIDNYIGDKN